MIEQAYRDALASSGAAFLAAERRLLQAGGEALALVRARAEAEEGADALVARALAARLEQDGALARVLAELEAMEHEGARTVQGGPSPLYVYSYLKKHYGSTVAAGLAAYLMKLWPAWPRWMTAGVAMYVGEMGGPEVSDALLPLALGTPDPYQREVASRALALSGDPAVAAKLEALVAAAPPADRPELHAAAEDVRRRVEAFG
ncbi:MAG TPA: hypothetical protein VEX86_07845 [Longimicrobium sp.]|nr:hypothetical protein [Longimicrobium sp.]